MTGHLVVSKVSHLYLPLYLHRWDLPHWMSSSLVTEEEFHNLNEEISLCVHQNVIRGEWMGMD